MLVRYMILLLIAATLTACTKTSTSTSAPVNSPLVTKTETLKDIKASFIIYTNGTRRDFTASKYHNQSTDIFLEAATPNIVNVKKSGLTWADFFKTLPMKLEKDCLTTGTGQVFCNNDNGSLKFYLNGQLNPNALEMEIKEGDKLLVTYGIENGNQVQDQLNSIPNP